MTDKQEYQKQETASQGGASVPQQSMMSIRTPSVEGLSAYLTAMNLPGVFNMDAPFVVVPNDIKALDVEKMMPRPQRMRQRIRFTEALGFIDYFQTFRPHAHPRLFVMGNDAGMRVASVFDYAMAPGKDHGATPMWGEHIAYLELAYAPDYAELRKRNAAWMSQDEFALFVEENTHLFVNPTGADMLELAQELKGVRNASWQFGKRQSNNAVRLEYLETVEARSVKGELMVPEYLEISTLIFNGYDAETFKAAFSWKMEGDKVKFSYRLLTKLAERKATEDVKNSIIKETKLPLYTVADFDGVIHSHD